MLPLAGFSALEAAMSDPSFEISTQRLRLVALTPKLLRLQMEDRARFFDTLNVAFEVTWPPELVDHSAMSWLRERMINDPSETGWHFWVFIWPGAGGQPDRLVGGGGFKGPPDSQGEIEIGYSMLISFREQGLATEAVEGLLSWARRHDTVKRVIAKTLPHLTASRRVLEKTDFIEVHECDEGGMRVVVYERSLDQAKAA